MFNYNLSLVCSTIFISNLTYFLNTWCKGCGLKFFIKNQMLHHPLPSFFFVFLFGESDTHQLLICLLRKLSKRKDNTITRFSIHFKIGIFPDTFVRSSIFSLTLMKGTSINDVTQLG